MRLVTIVLVATLMAGFAPLPTTEASAQPLPAVSDCRFVLGFKAVHDAIPEIVGDCKVNEHYNRQNGDALQETTKGLLVWRKLDNFTAFTDGYRTWVNGPYGVQQRLNTERFEWEGGPTPTSQAAPTPAARATAAVIVQRPPAPARRTEWVLLRAMLDDDVALVIRGNNELWQIEVGIGCLTLDWFEEDSIIIYSPSSVFAGIGAKVILPDNDEQCPIWLSEFLDSSAAIMETRIDDEFEGWEGDTIFKLRNGQIWQQASYAYTYHYAYAPRVLIFRMGSSRYRMAVEGVDRTIYVRRLR